MQVFYEAKEIGADLELIHLRLTQEPSVTGSNGLHFNQLIPFYELDLTAGDYLFVPGLPQPTLQSKAFKESLQYRNHLEDWIHKVQSWINQHLKSALTVESLAQLVHVSPRHLTRLFKEATGITIGRYIEELRVEKATQLLKQHHKLDFTATECGLADAKQLGRLLKKHLNRLPSEVSP